MMMPILGEPFDSDESDDPVPVHGLVGDRIPFPEITCLLTPNRTPTDPFKKKRPLRPMYNYVDFVMYS